MANLIATYCGIVHNSSMLKRNRVCFQYIVDLHNYMISRILNNFFIKLSVHITIPFKTECGLINKESTLLTFSLRLLKDFRKNLGNLSNSYLVISLTVRNDSFNVIISIF